jgi:uncharacterized membrane protein required for colicin V production
MIQGHPALLGFVSRLFGLLSFLFNHAFAAAQNTYKVPHYDSHFQEFTPEAGPAA